MAVAKLKYPKDENRLERLAERVANEINERAAKMTPEERAKADSELLVKCGVELLNQSVLNFPLRLTLIPPHCHAERSRGTCCLPTSTRPCQSILTTNVSQLDPAPTKPQPQRGGRT
jgi:hypothetical protein